MADGVDFAALERDFVRARINPEFAWRAYDAFSPLNPLAVPLRAARVAFVTTAGAHLPDQAPFDLAAPAGDPSYRAFPVATPLAELALSHRGYDTRRAGADKNVVLPLDHLRAAAAAGRIGAYCAERASGLGAVAQAASR